MLGERFLTEEQLNKIFSGKLNKNSLIGWNWENQFNFMISKYIKHKHAHNSFALSDERIGKH